MKFSFSKRFDIEYDCDIQPLDKLTGLVIKTYHLGWFVFKTQKVAYFVFPRDYLD